MSPRLETVERKLAALVGYVSELRPAAALTLDAYRRQGIWRRATERLLQVCVEAAADACAALVSAGGRDPASTMRGQFEAASAVGALPQSLAARLGDAAGLRNRLVHDYDRLDDDLVWAAARVAIRDIPAFIAAVTEYLERQEDAGAAAPPPG